MWEKWKVFTPVLISCIKHGILETILEVKEEKFLDFHD